MAKIKRIPLGTFMKLFQQKFSVKSTWCLCDENQDSSIRNVNFIADTGCPADCINAPNAGIKLP